MKKIAIIACDNGLGHVRRCYLTGLEFVRLGHAVDLFAPQHKFKKFVDLFESHPHLKNINFSTGTTAESLRAGDPIATHWYERLPDMKNYDVVISDNLPEILYVRRDAVLSGHFFWHDVLDEIPKSYRRSSKELIERYKPIVIASELFASDAVRSCRGYIPVGLYFYGDQNRDAADGDALLVTGGSTPALRAELQTLVTSFFLEKPQGFSVVFVDTDLLPPESDTLSPALPSWIKEATYDTEMYKRTRVAICRPGIGTITDLLQHGGIPICVYEPDNREVAENARRLHEMDLGFNVVDVRKAWDWVPRRSEGHRLPRYGKPFVLPEELLI